MVVQQLDIDFLDELQKTALDGTIHFTQNKSPAAGAIAEHDRLSFLVTMLVHLDLASRADILRILDYFDQMDINKDRTVSMTEIRAESARIAARIARMDAEASYFSKLMSGESGRLRSEQASKRHHEDLERASKLEETPAEALSSNASQAPFAVSVPPR